MLYTDNTNPYKEIREKSNLTQEKLSQIFIKRGYSELSRTTIGKLETGIRLANYKIVQAYCDYFNASADYFYGYSKTPTRDKATKSACEYLRLSDKTLSAIHSMSDEQRLILEAFINSPAIDEMTDCIDEWYRLSGGKTILIKGNDYSEETIPDDTQSKIKEYITIERLKNILNHITHTRPVTNHFMRKKMIDISTNIVETWLQAMTKQYEIQHPDLIESGDFDDLVGKIRNNLNNDIKDIKSTDYYKEFTSDTKPIKKKSKKKGSDTK